MVLNMEHHLGKQDISYNPRFLKFIKIFAAIGRDERFFPKSCNTCGRTYGSFPEYMKSTTPVGHSLEDYAEAMDSPFTMQYRNCSCGSTLVISFTEGVFPILQEFWDTLKKEAEDTGKDVREVVCEFRDQCNHYLLSSKAPF